MSTQRHGSANQTGFTLVEILVTAVIIAFGLLGLAGLQAKMTVTQMEAYQRAHALVLVEDMVARINSQRSAAKSGGYASLGVMTMVGEDQIDPDASCQQTDLVARDLCEWERALKGADVSDESGDFLGAMIGALGCIEWLSAPGDPVTLRVSVAWQGLAETQAPTLPCGRNVYDRESKRRVLATELILADL